MKTPSLRHLFVDFLLLGLASFGGPAMVAYIRKFAVEKRNWLTHSDFNLGVALCQSLPGMTAMQSTAFVGLRVRGIPGALAAFLGFVLPSMIIMTGITFLFIFFREMPVSQEIILSLQAMVVGIIANAVAIFWKTTVRSLWAIFPVFLAAGLFFAGINPVFVLLLMGALGFLWKETNSPPGKGPSESPLRFGLHYWRQVAWVLASILFILGILFFLSKPLFQLAILMAKIDLMAFGGGFASVPLMYHDIVEVRQWLDSGTFLTGIALGQVTPGPIAITATFAGTMLYGIPGALAATFGILFPSFLMLIFTVPFVSRLQQNPVFLSLTSGILLSFVGLLLSVNIKFILALSWNPFLIFTAVGCFLALRLSISILWVIGVSLVFSLLIFSIF
jgi:chromate transporter